MTEETSDRAKRLSELQKARKRELQRVRSLSIAVTVSLVTLAISATIFTLDMVSKPTIVGLAKSNSETELQAFFAISALFLTTIVVLFSASGNSDDEWRNTLTRAPLALAQAILRFTSATTIRTGTDAAERAIIAAREASEAKEREAQDFMRRPTDYIDVLTQFRLRMRGEERRLKINSVVNLVWGILFSLLSGWWLLFSVSELKTHGSYAKISDLMAAYAPRAALAVILQLVSFFFLRLYAATEQEIKHHKNEIANMESRFAGAMFDAGTSTPATRAIVLKSFMTVERNFLIKKGERTAATDVDTRYNDLLALVETLTQTQSRPQPSKPRKAK